MPNTSPLLEDTTVVLVYFDGIARAEVRDGVLRMTAYVCRLNAVTGECERVPVATLMRPAANSLQVFREISGALRRDNPALARIQ